MFSMDKLHTCMKNNGKIFLKVKNIEILLFKIFKYKVLYIIFKEFIFTLIFNKWIAYKKFCFNILYVIFNIVSCNFNQYFFIKYIL